MPSSYSQNGLELQAAGENLSTWGAPRLNNALKRANWLVSGYQPVAITGDYTLTSSSSSTSQSDFQANNGLLKFTGALSANATITVPSVAMKWAIWNATNKTLTFTTGSGGTVAVEAGDKTVAWCDGTNVNTISFGGYDLKTYIAASVLSATGSLPAATGNGLKFLYCDGASWLPTAVGLAGDVLTGTSATALVSPKAQSDAAAYIQLTDAASIVWDTNSGFNAFVILGGNRAVAAPSHLKDGWAYTLDVVQDATGSRTLTFDAIFDFGAGGQPVLSTGANKQDSLTFVYKARRTKLEFVGFRKAA
jgi:hypothetical protein